MEEGTSTRTTTRTNPIRDTSINFAHLSAGLVATGVVVLSAILIGVFLCILKRRRRNLRRRKELAENLRCGDERRSSDTGSESQQPRERLTTLKPEEDPEPEDIKELFYFYWKQGKTRAVQRSKSQQDDPRTIIEIQECPRRQTFSEGCFNKGVHHQHEMRLTTGLVDHRYRRFSESCRQGASACPDEILEESELTDYEDTETTYDFFRRGTKRAAPPSEERSGSHKSSKTKEGTSPSNAARIDIEDVHCRQHPSSRGPGNNSINVSSGHSRTAIRLSTESGTGDFNVECATPDEQVMDMGPGLQERSWSFSSLVFKWDFKSATLMDDIDIDDVDSPGVSQAKPRTKASSTHSADPCAGGPISPPRVVTSQSPRMKQEKVHRRPKKKRQASEEVADRRSWSFSTLLCKWEHLSSPDQIAQKESNLTPYNIHSVGN